MLKEGANAELNDKNGWTPLLWAARNGNEAAVKLLLITLGVEADSKVTKGHGTGRTALSWAAERGYVAIVKLLLGEGVGVDSKDERGWMPLSYAAKNGHTTIVSLLLENGAKATSGRVLG